MDHKDHRSTREVYLQTEQKALLLAIDTHYRSTLLIQLFQTIRLLVNEACFNLLHSGKFRLLVTSCVNVVVLKIVARFTTLNLCVLCTRMLDTLFNEDTNIM